MGGLVILQQMGVIFILVAIGYFLQKGGVLTSETCQKMSFVVVNVTNPCLILTSVLTSDLSVSRHDFLLALLVSVVFYAALALLGWLFPKTMRFPADEQKYYSMMIVYTNVGFMGIPIASAILPQEAMVYVVLCNVAFFFFFYTHGVSLLGGKGSFNWKKFLSPGILCSLLTIVLFWFDLRLPALIERSVTHLGNANVFLSMALLGASLAHADIRRSLSKSAVWLYSGFRLLIIPIALFYILRAAGLPMEMVYAFSLMAMMPAGNLPLIQAEADGLPTGTLSEGIVVSTVLSFFTITLLMSILF